MTRSEVLQRVVRIKDSIKPTKVMGTGMLVTHELILTCAHVVAESISIENISFDKDVSDVSYLGQKVSLDFPTKAYRQQEGDLQTATVVFYQAAESGDAIPDIGRSISRDTSDIALLRLDSPTELSPLSLFWDEPMDRIPVKVLGFPSGSEVDGFWRDGELSDPTARGWYTVKCRDETRGFLKGFSGGPVFDFQSGHVVGMTTLGDNDLRDFTIIPASYLLESDEALKLAQEKLSQEKLQGESKAQRQKRGKWLWPLGITLLLLASLFALRIPIAKRLTSFGETQYINNNTTQSIQTFKLASRISPNDANIPFNIAYAFSNGMVDREAEVEYYYQKAIALDATYVDAQNNLARFYLINADYDFTAKPLNTALSLLTQAEQTLKQVYGQEKPDNLTPESNVAQNGESKNRESEKQLPETISHLHSRILKNRAWAKLLLSTTDATSTESLASAKADIMQALSLDSEGAESYCILAEILEKQSEDDFDAWRFCLQYGEYDEGVLSSKHDWLVRARSKMRATDLVVEELPQDAVEADLTLSETTTRETVFEEKQENTIQRRQQEQGQ